MVATVVSVRDLGRRKLDYAVEFADTADPTNRIVCLIDGHDPIMQAMGREEPWWWDFVYKNGPNKSRRTFEITYTLRPPQDRRGLRAAELIGWKPR